MRCGYCYNPEIVDGKGRVSYEEALAFLEKRKNLLDGVVFSGGECTMHQDLPWLAHQIKSKGMKVKIDTNGSRPFVLESLITKRLVDYVALDFKSLPENFQSITKSKLFAAFEDSLELLVYNKVPFEVRTTLHSQLFSQQDITDMVSFLKTHGYLGNYYLQHFVGNTKTLEQLPPNETRKIEKDYSVTGIKVIWRN
jgi:pyruvate formate lyase activating enzyme